MQIVVCCPDQREVRHISRIIETLGAEMFVDARTVGFTSETALWRAFEPGRFRGAVIGWGDAQGFLCARRVWEEDGACRVILLDDTERYAVQSLRIHTVDYLVRPLEERRFRAAAERILTE